MEIIFATGNANKAKEAGKILSNTLTVIMPKELGFFGEIPETGNTLEANALEKCNFLWEKFGKTCFADDTGLEVEALNGEPGVYSARYAGPEKGDEANIQKLLTELAKAGEGASRAARFRTVVALIIEGERYYFEGILEGEITFEKSGTEGFGYDPIFKPKGYNKTLAQISLEEKNKISHRGIAMRRLAEYLNSKY